MQICIVSTQLCYILSKKNGILTLKNEMLKHADFASEWRKSRFRGLEISKFSGGGCPQTPYRGAAFGPPLFEPPMLKTWIHVSLCLVQ